MRNWLAIYRSSVFCLVKRASSAPCGGSQKFREMKVIYFVKFWRK
jgi:hypothetical protein